MLQHALLESSDERKDPSRSWPAVRGPSLSLDAGRPDANGPAKSGGLLREMPAVSVVFLMSAINAVSYGTLLFASAVPVSSTNVIPNGISVWLLSQFAAQIATMLFSDIQSGVCCPMIEMIPIFHAVFQTVSSKMPDSMPEEVQATCIASCFVCTATIGTTLLLGARFGLAKYLRAVPLIVLKGALFGVALFLISSSMSASVSGLPKVSLAETWHHCVPAVLLGLLLFALDEAVHSPVAISLSLLAIGLTPTILDALGVYKLEHLQKLGWVFDGQAGKSEADSVAWYEQLAQAYGSLCHLIHWDIILELVPTVLGIAASASLLMLMDLKAVELLTEREFTLEKELRSLGVSNLLSACMGGGWPCYILCSLNVTCHRLGGRTKFVGAVLSFSAVLSLFLVSKLLFRLPRLLPASLFMWLGLVFVKETIVDICSKHTHKSDVFIVAVMALMVKFYGFNDALLGGTLLAMGFFTVRYSGTQVGIRSSGDARFYRAICTRDCAEHSALEELGHLIEVVHVSGFLMFASTPAFTDALRELMGDDGPEWILLNCQNLQSLDYSAALELTNLGRKAKECQRRLVVTELTSCAQEVLEQARVELKALPGPGSSVPPGLYFQPHYQFALQRCEDGVLARLGQRMPSKSQPTLGSEEAFTREVLKRYFGDFLPEEPSLERSLEKALGIFERRSAKPGAVLWHAGEECTKCACVVEGAVHVYARPGHARSGTEPAGRRPGSPQVSGERLVCIAGPGDFVGFLAMINHFPYEHTARVASSEEEDDPSFATILVLEKSKYQELLTSDPPLGQALVRGFLRQISYEWRELSRLSAT